MSLSILSNFAANVAQRNLLDSSNQASSSVAKLSSGLRVLGAKDDAAALAIGSRLRAEVSAQTQAGVNAGQAVSLLQIADGALSKTNDILVRLKALAVQSGSDQLGSTERGLLDSEFQQLNLEIQRIAQDTEFNGLKLIEGGSKTVGGIANIATGSTIANADGFTKFAFDKSVADGAFEVVYNATNTTLTVTDLINGTVDSALVNAATVNALSSGETVDVRFQNVGLTITLNDTFSTTTAITTSPSGASAGANALVVAAGGVTLSSFDIKSTQGVDFGDATNAALSIDLTAAAASIVTLNVTGGTDFTGTVDLTSTGTKTATLTRAGVDSDGKTVTDTIAFDIVVGTAGVNGGVAETIDLANLDNVAFNDQQGTTTNDFTFKIGTGNQTFDRITISVDSATTDALGLTGLDIKTAANADTASTAISAAIDTLQSARANVGAFQNRLEAAASNLAITRENTEAARSALLDLDVASEIIKFTSTQILVQSGVSMLAQANQLPQNLLRLLQ